MAKKDDNLDAWRTQYPSSAVSWRISGDPDYAQRYIGEAKSLHYSVKNRMRLEGLKSLGDTWTYNDGTEIRVQSIFGQDFIYINAGRAEVYSCSIILLNVPEVVPPMTWYPSEKEEFIKQGEQWVLVRHLLYRDEIGVEGLDYIKTYYKFSSDCPSCVRETSPCESKILASDIHLVTGGTLCHPFVYDGTRYKYKGEVTPHLPGNVKDHCIEGNCQGEIIKFARDEGGTFFIWKAYTEWSNVDLSVVHFTKMGLGYILLGIKNMDEGTPLCSAFQAVKVDCCTKNPLFQTVRMMWDTEGSRCAWAPIWHYGSIPVCEVPNPPQMNPMYLWLQSFWSGVSLIVAGNLDGSCPPYTWALEGAGYLRLPPPGSESTNIAEYFSKYQDWMGDNFPPFDDLTPYSNNFVKITVKDRCGHEDILEVGCCQEAQAEGRVLEIAYYSLAMDCGGTQLFFPWYGCGPYNWSLSGGGSIVPYPDGSILFTAPNSNAGCENNATLTVTDGCGSSGSVQIAINCYAPATIALGICNQTNCWCYEITQENCVGWTHESEALRRSRAWACDDSVLWDMWRLGIDECTDSGRPPCGNNCPCEASSDDPPCWNCDYNCAMYEGSFTPCNILLDRRTPDMKAQGCCPLNPLTGLPYS
jgi:hypothetical protein